jgi:hypothetical protein
MGGFLLIVHAFCPMNFALVSANDKALYNYPKFSRDIKAYLPNGMYDVGDAGYTLSTQLIILYPNTGSMPKYETAFNYLHSKTRITIERSFGMLKNRFRIFKAFLNQKGVGNKSAPKQLAKIIEGCLVLHNILIELNDLIHQMRMLESPPTLLKRQKAPYSISSGFKGSYQKLSIRDHKTVRASNLFG